MADMFETVVGMAEPALRVVGRLAQDLRASVQKVVNDAVAEALKVSGVTSSGVAANDGASAAPPAGTPVTGPAAQAAPRGRVRPLRAPGR